MQARATSSKHPMPSLATSRARRQLLTLAACSSVGGLAWAKIEPSLKLGQSLPLTGPLASYGSAKKIGAEIALAASRAQLHHTFKTIEVQVLDDGYSAQHAVDNTYKFAKDSSCVGLVGYFGVPIIDQVLPVVEQQKIPLIGMTSGASHIRSAGYRYGFPVRTSYAQEASKLMDHLITVQQTRITVLVQGNSFGVEALQGLQNSIRNKKTIALELVQLPTDLQALPATLQAISPESNSIVLLVLSDLAIQIIPILRKQNKGQALYGLSALDASLLQAKLGDQAHGIVQTQVVPSPFGATSKLVRGYTQDMKKYASNHPSSYFGLEGYIEMRIVIEALKRIKSAPSREALRAAMESLGQIDLDGLDLLYRPNEHRGLQFVEMTVLGGGNTVVR